MCKERTILKYTCTLSIRSHWFTKHLGLDRSLSGADDTDDFQDEVEVLRDIWEKQGVGKDGYLTFHELGEICENMGMEKMSDKVWVPSK